MVAGFQAHVHAGAGEVGSGGAGGGERVGLGVRGTGASVVAHVQQVSLTVGDDGSDKRVRPANTLAGGIEGQAHRLIVAEGLLGTRQVQGAGGGYAGEVPVLGGGVIQVVNR